jgi:hypothetical protein
MADKNRGMRASAPAPCPTSSGEWRVQSPRKKPEAPDDYEEYTSSLGMTGRAIRKWLSRRRKRPAA